MSKAKEFKVWMSERIGHSWQLQLALEAIKELELKELNNDLLVMANARQLIKAHKSTSNARLCMELFGTGYGTARDYCRKLNLEPDSNSTPFNQLD
ncbi:MAG: hypothetical protein Unbinned5350contig1004_6 [Prokaryotic dsDNA virus sp.]|nr:MAG: hypothetical protein Unbinned5350contig1004_6 [Prokaryotic dsDNA virus sp.]